MIRILGILFIGDVFGKPGRQSLPEFISKVKREHPVDLIIANGENAAGGNGITRATAEEIFMSGVDIITGGNHIWDQKEALSLLEETDRIIRPANYPSGVPGQGQVVVEVGVPPRRVLVINLLGRALMREMDCPFATTARILEETARAGDIVIIDFHAETTSEKAALGHYLDGKVTAILGTHTHVQTADERLLPKGSAFISDVGMTGPLNSVIGVKIEPILHRFLTALPVRHEVAEGPVLACGVYLRIPEDSHLPALPPARLQQLIDPR